MVEVYTEISILLVVAKNNNKDMLLYDKVLNSGQFILLYQEQISFIYAYNKLLFLDYFNISQLQSTYILTKKVDFLMVKM